MEESGVRFPLPAPRKKTLRGFSGSIRVSASCATVPLGVLCAPATKEWEGVMASKNPGFFVVENELLPMGVEYLILITWLSKVVCSKVFEGSHCLTVVTSQDGQPTREFACIGSVGADHYLIARWGDGSGPLKMEAISNFLRERRRASLSWRRWIARVGDLWRGGR